MTSQLTASVASCGFVNFPFEWRAASLPWEQSNPTFNVQLRPSLCSFVPHTMSSDPTKLLPDEVIGTCIDLGDTPAILRASHVCARWRATARRCPGFWRRLRIVSSSPTALDFFRTRIGSSGLPGIEVVVFMHVQGPKPSPNAVFQFGLAAATVRMELERHLHRTASLSISAEGVIMNAIAPTLATSSGSLSFLALRVLSTLGATTQYGWSKNWISDSTPLLRTISLENIAISTMEPERWFSSATDIRFSFTRGDSVFVLPSDLFHRFRHGARVSITTNPGARIAVAPPMIGTPPRVQPLSTIALIGDEAVRLVLPLIPRTPITQVIIAGSCRGFDLEQFLLDLTGPLKLRMRKASPYHTLSVLFQQPGSIPLTRYAHTVSPTGHDFVDTATAFFARLPTDIMHRVTSISVHLDSVHLLGLMGAAVQVPVLEIEVYAAYNSTHDVAESLPVGRVRDTFPQLRRVIVRPGRPNVPRPHNSFLARLMHKFFGPVEGHNQTGGRSRPEFIVTEFPVPRATGAATFLTVASQRPM